jgi:hypothetical protein
MPTKEQKERQEETLEGLTDSPSPAEASAGELEQPAPTGVEAATTRPPLTEEEARAAVADASEPMHIVSALDRSLIITQSPPLSREQLNNLRDKLKAKFH